MAWPEEHWVSTCWSRLRGERSAWRFWVLTGDDVRVDMDEPVLLEVPLVASSLFDAESEQRNV